LDTCEHINQALCLLALRRCRCAPTSRPATSREPLNVPGEVIWQVPPMQYCDEAMQLFLARARAVRPDFALDEEEQALLVQIVSNYTACRWRLSWLLRASRALGWSRSRSAWAIDSTC
jgi:predicted ATPase